MIFSSLQMCKDLANSYDRIRRSYWDYIARSIAHSTSKDTQSKPTGGSTNEKGDISTNEESEQELPKEDQTVKDDEINNTDTTEGRLKDVSLDAKS